MAKKMGRVRSQIRQGRGISGRARSGRREVRGPEPGRGAAIMVRLCGRAFLRGVGEGGHDRGERHEERTRRRWLWWRREDESRDGIVVGSMAL